MFGARAPGYGFLRRTAFGYPAQKSPREEGNECPDGGRNRTHHQGAAPPLHAAENEQMLFARWQRHRDHGAREALVRRYMPLARSLARRYGRSSEPFEDLLQVASLGLLKALDR